VIPLLSDRSSNKALYKCPIILTLTVVIYPASASPQQNGKAGYVCHRQAGKYYDKPTHQI